ncbi:MAG: hypothetical protein ABIQ40_00900 [Bacteroidia bacterium]
MYYDTAGRFVRRCYWTSGMGTGDLYELKLTYDSTLDKKGISRIKTHVFGKLSWRDSIVLSYDENGYPLRKKQFRVTRFGVDVNADYHFAYTNSRRFNHLRVFTVYLNDTTNFWELKYNKYNGELWYKVYYISALGPSLNSKFTLMPLAVDKDSVQLAFGRYNGLSTFSDRKMHPYCFFSLWSVSYYYNNNTVLLTEDSPIGTSFDKNGCLKYVFEPELLDSTIADYNRKPDYFIAKYQYNENNLPISLIVRNDHQWELHREKYYVYKFSYEFYQ